VADSFLVPLIKLFPCVMSNINDRPLLRAHTHARVYLWSLQLALHTRLSYSIHIFADTYNFESF